MSHYTHDELVLYYYGEGRRHDRVERHLETCTQCRAEYDGITAALAAVGPADPPERDERYGLEVWQRIRHQLPAREPVRWWPVRPAPALATAAVLVLGAFVAGRLVQRGVAPGTTIQTQAPPADHTSERIRLDALGDHLDRSERLLLDVEHDDTRDIRDEQSWASDLVDANRLYRDAAIRAGDSSSAAVLDDLERQLLDIVHAPAKPTREQLEELRTRLEAAALLFKVRVLRDQLREREAAPAVLRKKTT